MSMYLKNCIACNALFQAGPDTHICPECVDIFREDWDKVRHFLHINKEVTVGSCAEATGVSERVIRLFIKQEKIRVVG